MLERDAVNVDVLGSSPREFANQNPYKIMRKKITKVDATAQPKTRPAKTQAATVDGAGVVLAEIIKATLELVKEIGGARMGERVDKLTKALDELK